MKQEPLRRKRNIHAKPFQGTFLLRLPGDGEITRLRKELKGERK